VKSSNIYWGGFGGSALYKDGMVISTEKTNGKIILEYR
jgi:hypothetical protein